MGLLTEVAPGFYNARGKWKAGGVLEFGTQMSIVKLESGMFIVIDSIEVSVELKNEIDMLTSYGSKIEAVMGVHPFHTMHFDAFYRLYPNALYIGTPRHLRIVRSVPWTGDFTNCKWRNFWSPEIEMRIPEGAEFEFPVPERTNHFSSVFFYHRASRTLHVDDTIMYFETLPLIVRLIYSKNSMVFHLSIKV
eukprot:TRINITY_DN1721_c0_g2_i2.p1 TRINITY_DN1721_c0_g2~~TRINITY_DN1721_c0_g2_i2.p1  ORF type:complete len:215 (+),score=4.45 TRINITY_DN1721_c0_g2_i2:70-645(+)